MKLRKFKEKMKDTIIRMLKSRPALQGIIIYAVSMHYVYAASNPLAPLKKLVTMITSMVALYGAIQAALGVLEAGKSLGGHDSTGVTNGLLRLGGGALMCFVGAVLTYLGLKS